MDQSLQNVFRLSDYRKRRLRSRQQQARRDCGAVYYCLRCDGDEFKLQASGGVSCTHCGALMRNLFVQASAGEETPQ